ncbi:MAG TPA: hypothetical protein VMD05_10175 [Candidatus Nanoarchaeia archaeon]|nr:hypothetical protein [Candidatus Nanoarchaeia archaeon]
MSSIDKQIEEISQGILVNIEQTSLKDLSSSNEVANLLHLTDVHRAKNLVEHLDKASTQTERNSGKIEVIKALLLASWLQRLYFIIRSLIMGILSAVIYLTAIIVLGSINFANGIVLGVFSFAFSLVVSRFFDKQIVRITKAVVTFLGKHQRLKDVVINHL